MMTVQRYRRAPKLKRGKFYGTFSPGLHIYRAVQRNKIKVTSYTTSETERLDVLAGKYYGDGTLWWVIAAASGIGWNLQVPPGTYLAIPLDITQLNSMLG